MMKSFLALILLSLLPATAFAKVGGGAGAASSALKSPSSLLGLCSQDEENQGKRWTEGKPSLCDDIDETLDGQKGCNVSSRGGKSLDSGKTLVEQLRNDEKFVQSLEEACPGKIQSIKGDETKFKLFLKQLMAVLTIQENEWKSKPVSSMGAKGLMQLSKDSVKAYGKCNDACKQLGRTGDFSSAQGDHLTMKCGVTIGLYWMAKDSTMGTGSGNKGSRGLARYYQPFRKIDKKNRQWMMGKLKNYCDNRIDQDGGNGSSGKADTTK